MNLLVDTHVLIWGALNSGKLTKRSINLLSDPDVRVFFSAISIWEVAIKKSLGRSDFQVEPGQLRAGLLSNDYTELPLDSRHCLGLATLRPIHNDPFDRILIAQAVSEGLTLLTADSKIMAYDGPILSV